MSLIQFYQKFIGSFFQINQHEDAKLENPELLVPVLNAVDLMQIIDDRILGRLGHSNPFKYALSLGHYSDQLHNKRTDLGQLIYLMKYRFIREAADKALEFTWQNLKNIDLPYQPDLVISIPDSLVNRPFSPTRLIAYGLADYFDSQRVVDLIHRRRLALPQKHRQWSDKISDSRLRYHISDRETVRNKHILLFDDIFDTGQTALEAGYHLRSAGAKSVMLLTLVYLGYHPPN